MSRENCKLRGKTNVPKSTGTFPSACLQGHQSNSIHNRGLVGHVEEIAVAREHQGKKLGLKLIQALDSIGKNVGCYKNILNCGPQNEAFYVKCGYHNSGTEMSRYFYDAKDNYHRG